MNPTTLNTTPLHEMTYTCSLCLQQKKGYGNNPAPLSLSTSDRCCNKCNAVVLFVRIGTIINKNAPKLNVAQWIKSIRDDEIPFCVFEMFPPQEGWEHY